MVSRTETKVEIRASGREAAQRTLDGEDRSAIIRGEGKGVQEDETGRS